MNHIYRLVWNAAAGTWMAVAENAAARGKGSHRVKRAAAVATALALTMPAFAQQTPSVVVSSGQTNAYVAPNGVTVVNIAAPNAAGLSHNLFNQYNVNAMGLVLNNGNSDMVARQSQLAGQVTANFNLTKQAGVILNEVVSNNRSTLAGFTEVLGGKADVVLANPYGITCSGCGFINTDRVVLTTGNPFLAADGSLGGFNVSKGDILITGTGLNASAQQVLDLVTRSVRIEAPVNALDLGVTTGANQWDYNTRGVTGAVTASGTVPNYAIDSSALGGMYANRIRLTATEAGVGVRMLGNAAASAGDFALSSAGKIEIASQVSAQHDVLVASTSNDAAAIALTGATLTAGNNAGVTAAQGGLALDGSAVFAGTDLNASAAAVSAGPGSRLQAGNNLQASATAGDLALGAAAVLATHDIALSASGKLSTAAGSGQGVQSTAGNVALAAGQGVDNAGVVTAGAGGVTVRNGGTLANSGKINAGQDLDIADAAGGATQSIDNSGDLLAGRALTLAAADVNNRAAGWIQAATGSSVQAASIDNSGAWLLSQQAGGADKLAVGGALVNSGTLQSAGDLSITAQSIANQHALLAAGALDARTSANFDNAAGATTQAGTTLALHSDGALTNGAQGVLKGPSITLDAGQGVSNDGVVSADSGDALLRVNGTITNTGSIQAAGALDIADRQAGASENLDNSGDLLAGGALALKAAAITNQAAGWVQASSGSTIGADSLANAGTWLLSQAAGAKDSVALSGALTNQGTMQSAGSATLQAASIDNQGVLLAAADLDATGTKSFTNEAGATTQAGQALGIASDGTVTNAASGALKGASVAVGAGQDLDNSGVITADSGNATLHVDGTLDNQGQVNAAQALNIASRSGGATPTVSNSGDLIAGQTLSLDAGTVSNTKKGWIQASAGSQVSAASLDNAGTWQLSRQAGNTSKLDVSGTLTNESGAVLQAVADANLNAASIANQGKLLAGGNLSAQVTAAKGFDNAGTVQAGGTLGITGSATALQNEKGANLIGDRLNIAAASIDNAGVIQGGTSSASTVTASGTFTNESSGVVTMGSTSAGTGTLSAQGVSNDGTLQSLGGLTVALGTGGLSTNGSILTNGDLAIQSLPGNNDFTATVNGTVQSGGKLSVLGSANSKLQVNAGKSLQGNSADIEIGTVSLANQGVIASTGNMTLDTSNLALAGDSSTTARILAAQGGTGTGTVTVANALTNDGLIFSGNDLSVSAPSITNSGTGGIAALHDLTLAASAGTLDLTAATPAGSAGVFTNNGALYAGHNLALTANGSLLNTSTTSTINAGNAITIRANTVVNSREINSLGSIDIVAATLRNEVPGGDTRGSTSTESTAVATADGGGYDDGDSGGNLDKFQDYVKTWTVTETYGGGTPTFAPQIIAGTTARLAFTTGTNLGGVISAGQSINLQGFSADASQGNGSLYAAQGISDAAGHGFKLSGASFTNDSLALTTTTYTQHYTLHTKYIALGPAKKYTDHLCVDGDYDSGCHYNGYVTTNVPVTTDSLHAGLYTTTLTGSGFSLVNNGATSDSSTIASARSGSSRTASVTTPGTQTGPAGGQQQNTSNGSSVDNTGHSASATGATARGGISFLAANAANGVQGLNFGGISLTLPTNPNGFFVTATEPGAHYLVESNPRYMLGSSSVGSDYLAKLLGYDPDQTVLRLGDASYEAYVVKQELIAQTGNSVLASYQNSDAQMQGLMENAAGESKSLGLTYGEALTPAQQAALTHDIVWMVQTEVNGQTVLAPVVYLAQSTKNNIASGAVISTQDANLALSSLTNTGGTIVGSKSLVVASAGDISNLSGTIKGGDVSLTSTNGSIVNKTLSSGSGNDQIYVTTVGKTAGIESTGTLALDAKKDITNLGATVTAGTDASLKAGGNVTFDTIQNKNASTTFGAYEQDGGTGSTSTTTTTTKQIKSGLTVGGNLSASAGNDITLAGTDAKVGGNADLNAGNNLNIVAREDTTNTHTVSQASGIGMGGALYGSSKTVTDTESGRNVGSTLQVGGNANLSAKNDVTLQGSNVDVKGSGSINATNVNVLAGQNYDNSQSTTTTTSILKATNGGTQTSSDSGSGSSASAGGISAQAGAEASASTGAHSTGGLAFASSSTTQTNTTDSRSVGSSVNFGGDLTVNASKDVTLQGSTVAAGGNASVNAQNVNVLAAENVSTSSTRTTTTTVGLMGSSDNKADAGAKAGANATAGVLPNASANASAEANASSENKLDLMQTSTTTRDQLDVTHTGSSITAGGNLGLNAGNAVNVQGSQLAAGGDVSVKGKDVTFGAVNDVHQVTTSSDMTSVGLYADAKANAKAEANASADVTGGKADASASASAGLEVGLYGSNTKSSSVDGSTTAVTSGITAGGSINRNASNSITDVGTNIAAGGDLNQSAKTITSLAAANTTYSSSSSDTNTAKIGAYAEASVGASAEASTQNGAKTENGASAGAGIRASYSNEQSSSQSASSDAVVSTIKVGGNVNSTSSGTTTLEGTNIAAGRDVTIGASSLDYSAAKNTSSSSSTNTSAGGSVGVDLVNKSVSVGANYDNGKDSASSSTAVVGGIQSGGNLTVKTTGDTRFEGTNLAAGGAATVAAGGNLTFDAAKNTSTSSSQSVSASLDATVGKKASSEGSSSSKGFDASAGYSQSNASSSDAVTGSITSGGPLNVSAGNNATFTGTALASGGDAKVSAGGDLAFNAAHSTSSSQSVGVDASIGASSGKETKGGTTTSTKGAEGSLGVTYGNSQSDQASGATIVSGGNVALSSGRNTTLEGTGVAAAGTVDAKAGGTVTLAAARSSSSGVDFAGSVGGSYESEKKTPAAPGTPGSTPAKPAATGTTSTTAGAKEGAAEKPEKPEQPEKTVSGGLALSVTGDASSQATTLQGGKGVTVQSNVPAAAKPPQVAAHVDVPANLPAGKTLTAATADGKPLPSWLSFDPKTGTFQGTPPADFKGDLKINVNVPQADGSVKAMPVSFAGK